MSAMYPIEEADCCAIFVSHTCKVTDFKTNGKENVCFYAAVRAFAIWRLHVSTNSTIVRGYQRLNSSMLKRTAISVNFHFFCDANTPIDNARVCTP